jgi:hypothetical protein
MVQIVPAGSTALLVGVHVVYYAPAWSASAVWRRGDEGCAAGERAGALHKIVGVCAGAFLRVEIGIRVCARTMADDDAHCLLDRSTNEDEIKED